MNSNFSSIGVSDSLEDLEEKPTYHTKVYRETVQSKLVRDWDYYGNYRPIKRDFLDEVYVEVVKVIKEEEEKIPI
jgi:hypothetical protein